MKLEMLIGLNKYLELKMVWNSRVKQIIDWIRKQVNEAGATGVVTGLSGGIDSSCTAILCKKAFPNNTIGIIMPCLSNPKDKEHAELVAKMFDITFEVIDLEESFKTLFKSLSRVKYAKEKHEELTIGNIKPRLRMTVLYYFANKLNYLVVGTDNKTESLLGYFTKYGDGGVDILPLVDLYKRDIRELAKQLEIPKEIIEKKPSAGLWDGQTDEDEIGMEYDEVDEIIERMEKNKDLNDIRTKKIKEMIANSEHKRKMPSGCKLTERGT